MGKLLDHLCGYCGRDNRAVLIGDSDALRQFGNAASFQKVTACSIFQRPEYVFVIIKGGKHNDLHIRPPLFEQSGSFYAVHAGHTDIHQNHIRAFLLRTFQRLGYTGYRIGHPDIFANAQNYL